MWQMWIGYLLRRTTVMGVCVSVCLCSMLVILYVLTLSQDSVQCWVTVALVSEEYWCHTWTVVFCIHGYLWMLRSKFISNDFENLARKTCYRHIGVKWERNRILVFLGFDGMLSSAVVAIINNIRKSYPFVSLLMWSLHLLTQTSAGHC